MRTDLATISKARLSFPQTTPVPDLVGAWSFVLPNLDSPLLFSFGLYRKPLKGHFVVFVAMLELGKKQQQQNIAALVRISSQSVSLSDLDRSAIVSTVI